MVTVAEIEALYDKLAQPLDRQYEPHYWLVNRTYVRILRKMSLAARKKFPVPRALRRSVHRAYRRAGLPLPRVSRPVQNP